MNYIKLPEGLELLNRFNQTLSAEYTYYDGTETQVGHFVPKGTVQARYMFRRALAFHQPVLIYGDPDIDGAVAAFEVLEVLEHFKMRYEVHINSMRQHGFMLTAEELKKYKGWLIIAVDFLMTKEEINMLTEAGISIISIDHHYNTVQEEADIITSVGALKPSEVCDTYIDSSENLSEQGEDYFRNFRAYLKGTNDKEKTDCPLTELRSLYIKHMEEQSRIHYGVLINNFYPFEPKEFQFLSGAGMVYYVFKSFCSFLDCQRNHALVGWTLLSDNRELKTDLARGFLNALYTWNDSWSNYLIQLTKPDIDYDSRLGPCQLDNNFVVYTLNPAFNAIFRRDKSKIAFKLLKYMYHADEYSERYYVSEEFKKCRSFIQTTVTFQRDVISYLIRLYEDKSDMVTVKEFSHLTVIQYVFPKNDTYTLYPNYIGLALNKFKSRYQTTAIIALYFVDPETGEFSFVRGSMRGRYDRVPYLSCGTSLGLHMIGHEGACGLKDLPLDYGYAALNRAYADAEVEYKNEGLNHFCTVDTDSLNKDLAAGKTVKEDFSLIAYHNSFVENSDSVLVDFSGLDFKIHAFCKNETVSEETRCCCPGSKGACLYAEGTPCVCRCWTYDVYALGISVKTFSPDITPKTCYVRPYLNRNHIQFTCNSDYHLLSDAVPTLRQRKQM